MLFHKNTAYRIIPLVIFLYASITLSASNRFIYINKENRASFDSIQKLTKEPPIYVYLDFNDCFNCNLVINSIQRNAALANRKTAYVLNHVSPSKAKLFLTENGITPFLLITNSHPLTAEFERMVSKNWEAGLSLVLKYYGDGIAEKLSFKNAANTAVWEKFMVDSLPSKQTGSLKDDSIFYTSISKVSFDQNRIITLLQPKATVHIFDSSGSYIGKIALSQKELVSYALPFVLNDFNESVRTDTINSAENTIKRFNEQIRTYLGNMEMTRINNFVFQNDTLYLSSTSLIPIFDRKEDKIQMYPFVCLLKYDKHLKLVDKSPIELGSGFALVDFYGMLLSKDGTKLWYSILHKADPLQGKKFTKYFLGKWQKNGNSYPFVTKDSSIHFSTDLPEIREKQSQELMFKFNNLNDSLISFEYLPLIINLRNNQNMQTLAIDTSEFYSNELTDVIIMNGKSYVLTVEQISKGTYVTLLDWNFNRLISKRLSVDSEKTSSSKYFILNNQLKWLSISNNGTSINTIDISGLF